MQEGGLFLVAWSFLSLCMTGASILFYTKMHRQLFKLLTALVLAPVTFITVQFTLTVLCLNELLRYCVRFLIWVRYRGSAWLSQDGSDSVWEYKSPGNSRMITIPIILTSNATLFEHSIGAELEKRLFEDGNSVTAYKKLKSVIFSFCNYVAWRDRGDFNIRNHVRTLRRIEVCTETDVGELLADLSKDMDTTKPQWEVVIIKSFLDESDGTEKSLVIFRFHHAYLDGISLLMMLNKLSDDYHYMINPLTSGLPTWKMTLHYISALIFGPLQILHSIFNSFRRHWIPNQKIGFGQKHFHWSRNRIMVESLQRIRLQTKASFTNILSLAFVESCRRLLPKERLVNNVIIGEVLALLPYPNTLPQNRFTTFSYTADLSPDFVTEFSLTERLEAVKEEAQDSITGPQPLLVYWLFKLIGRLPKILFPVFMTGTQDSFYISNVPFAKDKFTLFQGECQAVGAFPPCFNDTGIMLATLTYQKWISFCISADASWLTSAEVRSILDEIPNVIEELGRPDKIPVVMATTVPELLELPQEEDHVKPSISDCSDLSAQSHENLTDSSSQIKHEEKNMKKKKIRSRNKPKGSSKAL